MSKGWRSARTAVDRVLPVTLSVQCRIQIRRDAEGLVIRLAGRLSEAEVPDLLQACLGSIESRVLELDELVSTDQVGIDALMRIERCGVRLVGLPEYVRLELDSLARENTP